jgi:hypothetical protein
MADDIIYQVGDLVTFISEKAARQWPNFTFGKTYEVNASATSTAPQIWDDQHDHNWWINVELIKLVARARPEDGDLWTTP